MKTPRFIGSLLVFALGPGLFATNSPAATAPVSVGDDFFSPATTTINQNDSVMWTWTGFIDHSSTSDTGDATLWDSGIVGHGSTFTFKFTSAGSFPYHCNVHSFQVGTVNVQAVTAPPPTVAITGPANNSTFVAPASFTLAATASASGSTISQVAFFSGTTALGTAASSPYQVNITNLAAGTFTLSAVATAASGEKATNSVIIQVVAPSPLVLSGGRFAPPASFQFSYSTDAGVIYAVDRTLDFTTWFALQTNMANGTSATFTDAGASAGAGFYRVRRVAGH